MSAAERALVAGLCAVGLGDALYLTFFETSALASCAPGTTLNCAVVLTSSYSRLLGVPVSFVAALWFLALGWTQAMPNPPRALLLLLSAVGLLGAVYFISIELFVLKAICSFCTLAHAVGLAAVGLTLRRIAQSAELKA